MNDLVLKKCSPTPLLVPTEFLKEGFRPAALCFHCFHQFLQSLQAFGRTGEYVLIFNHKQGNLHQVLDGGSTSNRLTMLKKKTENARLNTRRSTLLSAFFLPFELNSFDFEAMATRVRRVVSNWEGCNAALRCLRGHSRQIHKTLINSIKHVYHNTHNMSRDTDLTHVISKYVQA